MNKNLKDKFMNMQGMTDVEQFFTILELPDAQFNAVYPELKKNLAQVYDSNAMRKQLLEQLETMPTVDLEAEFSGVEQIIEEIKNDESLSDNKKEMLTDLMSVSARLLSDLVKNPREQITVKITRISEDAILPTYAHDTDAGADVYAIEETVIKPYQTVIVKTGIKVAIPKGYEIQIRPRSGLSSKTNLRIANAPGTIDADYRGEVGVIMTNIGGTTATIAKGDRIAQMVIMPVPMIKWEEVDSLDSTERNEKGFGSTDQE